MGPYPRFLPQLFCTYPEILETVALAVPELQANVYADIESHDLPYIYRSQLALAGYFDYATKSTSVWIR